jgi:putative pyridoxal-dependent aspartate 1-decarboxylase
MSLSTQSIFNRFDEAALNYRDQIALVFKNRPFSFSEVKEEVERLCRKLIQAGIKEGQLVSVQSERSPQYLIALLALLKIGAVYLPLDAKLPEARKQWILHQSQSSFVIICKSDIASLSIVEQCPQNPPSLPKEAMYVMYTSGSSGTPKGVIGTHEGLLNRVDWMQRTFPIHSTEVHVMKTQISFVDHIAEAFQSLLSGASLLILPDEEVKDVEVFLQRLAHYRVNRLVLVPSLLKTILQFSKQKKISLNHLRYIFSSGEVLPLPLAKLCSQQFPLTRLINIYGTTEVSADALYYEVDFTSEKRIEELFKRPYTSTFSRPNKPLEELFPSFSSVEIPHKSIPYKTYLSQLKENVIPYSVDVSHPEFIAHMTSGLPDAMGQLTELVCLLNQNTVKIETSKAFTLLERQVLGKLHSLFYGLPASFYALHIQSAQSCLGMLLSGGTLSNIQALHIAKHVALIKAGSSLEEIQKKGFYEELTRLGYKGTVILGSPFLHYSFQKAASILGLSKTTFHKLECEKDHKINLKDLESIIHYYREQKFLIIAIAGVAGSTEVGHIDPLDQIAKIAEKEGIFFHVDAAWGGPVLFSPRYKSLLKGMEKADSITICGHKQLYTPMGTSVLLLKDPQTAFLVAIHANYQSRKESHDQGQFSLIGSKPASAVYIDAGFQLYGASGYQFLIERGCEMAKIFAKIIQKNPAFELVSYPEINIFTYRYLPLSIRNKKQFSTEDQETISKATYAIQQEQFAKAKTCVSYTSFIKDENEIGVFRVVLANPLTTIEHLYLVLEDQLKIASELFNEPIKTPVKIPLLSASSTTVPIGYPIHDCEVFLFDENQQQVSGGTSGEIYIGGAPLSIGYLNDSTQNKERFIPHPLDPTKKLYRTGDFGKKLLSGAIEYLGRQDQQVKIRGFRVDLLEVEQQIYTLPSVRQTCVLALEEELAAFYSLKEKALPFSPQKMKDHLKQILPDYMVPTKSFSLDSLPLLPNGKIDRQSLYQLLKMQKKKPEILSFAQHSQNSIEQLSSICKALLETSSIDHDTNFFDIGFTSLSLNILLLKLQEMGFDELKLTHLYSYPTIAMLGDFLQKQKKTNRSKTQKSTKVKQSIA